MKRDMYEGGIRVPMIVLWTGAIKPGQVSDFPWAFWDFLPTAADLANARSKVPPHVDGQSVLPMLLGREMKRHEFMYWEFHEKGSKQAVRLGNWKAIRPALNQSLELYDLSSDLGETNNVAPAHPGVVARIESYLKTARTESAPWPLTLPPGGPARARPANVN
jgi:arylsulfatase A-like enzyme